MKKIFVTVLISLFILVGNVVMVLAQPGYINYRDQGPSYHRIDVLTDSTNPTTTTGAFSCESYSHVYVFCDVSGTSPSWTVTPLFWAESSDGLLEQYFAGSSTTVTSDTVYVLAVDSEKYLYLTVTSGSATNGDITILLQPCNRL